MERLYTLIFAAGIGCFFVAFVLSMVFPWMSLDSYHGMEYQTLEELAEVPSEEFVELSESYPEAFREAFGEVSSGSYAEALQRGRDIYAGQACWHCHSQYVRVVSNEEQRWGPPSTAQEYQNALSKPHLWGTRRVGPDLSREKGRQADERLARGALHQPQERRRELGHAALRVLLHRGRGAQARRLRADHLRAVARDDLQGRIQHAVTNSDTHTSFSRGLHTFFVLAILAAGCMFIYKLFAFLSTIRRDELAGFAFDPIVIYGVVAIGFLFLLGWAYLTGQFRDIERPKYEMFERFEEQERRELRDLEKQAR